MSINRIRYQQQIQQLKAVRSVNISNMAVYESRDKLTGLRVVQTADGGIGMVTYISNSIPTPIVALSRQYSSIGRNHDSYATQKPY